MARYKPQGEICPVQVACDGVTMHVGSTICTHCKDKLARQAKLKARGAAKLKGEVRRGP